MKHKIVPYNADELPCDVTTLLYTNRYKMKNRRLSIGLSEEGWMKIQTKRLMPDGTIAIGKFGMSPEATACFVDSLKKWTIRSLPTKGGE